MSNISNKLRKIKKELDALIIRDGLIIDHIEQTRGCHLAVTVRSAETGVTGKVFGALTPSCNRSRKHWRSDAKRCIAQREEMVAQA